MATHHYSRLSPPDAGSDMKLESHKETGPRAEAELRGFGYSYISYISQGSRPSWVLSVMAAIGFGA